MTSRILEIHDTLIDRLELAPRGELVLHIGELSTFDLSADGHASGEVRRRAMLRCDGARLISFDGVACDEWFVVSGGLLLADGRAITDLDELEAGAPVVRVDLRLEGGARMLAETKRVTLVLREEVG